MRNYRDNIQEIRAAMKAGDTATIAAEVGCSAQTVRNALRKSQAVRLTSTEKQCIELLAEITAPRIRAARRIEQQLSKTLQA